VMMSGLGAWSFTVIREFWLFPRSLRSVSR
jgi:hypothetical protein